MSGRGAAGLPSYVQLVGVPFDVVSSGAEPLRVVLHLTKGDVARRTEDAAHDVRGVAVIDLRPSRALAEWPLADRTVAALAVMEGSPLLDSHAVLLYDPFELILPLMRLAVALFAMGSTTAPFVTSLAELVYIQNLSAARAPLAGRFACVA